MNSNFANLKRTGAPTSEILTLAQGANYLRAESDTGGPVDQDITDFIAVAREQCEVILGRTLLQSTWQLSLRNWPGRDYQNWPTSGGSDLQSYYANDHIQLPMAAPLASVTSVTYRDTSNAEFTMPQGNVAGGYNVDPNFEPGRIVLPFSQIWPTAILLPGAAIQIVYVAGYANLAALKASFEGYNSVLMAMKMILAYCYETRLPPAEVKKSITSSAIQFVVEELLTPFRIFV